MDESERKGQERAMAIYATGSRICVCASQMYTARSKTTREKLGKSFIFPPKKSTSSLNPQLFLAEGVSPGIR